MVIWAFTPFKSNLGMQDITYTEEQDIAGNQISISCLQRMQNGFAYYPFIGFLIIIVFNGITTLSTKNLQTLISQCFEFINKFI